MNGIRFGRDEQQLCLASLGTHLVTPLFLSLLPLFRLPIRAPGPCLGDCHLLHYQEGDEIWERKMKISRSLILKPRICAVRSCGFKLKRKMHDVVNVVNWANVCGAIFSK